MSYRESNEFYHVTSSEDDSDVEVIQNKTPSVINVPDETPLDADEGWEDASPKFVIRGDKREMRHSLRRKSHENRQVTFNSQRKQANKVPQQLNCNNDTDIFDDFKRSLMDSHISEKPYDDDKQPSAANKSRDVNVNWSVSKRLPPIERASDMFYARQFVPHTSTIAIVTTNNSSRSRRRFFIFVVLVIFLMFIPSVINVLYNNNKY